MDAFPGEKLDKKKGRRRVVIDRPENRPAVEKCNFGILDRLGKEPKSFGNEGDRFAQEFARAEPGDVQLPALLIELEDPNRAGPD